jgi:hypothetical protein
MVIRVVAAVLLSVALLSVSMPAIDNARVTTSTERVETTADRIERAAAGLAADSVAVTDPTLAGRSVLVVTAPSGFTAASIDRLRIVDASANTTQSETDGVRLVYRFRHGSLRTVHIPPPTDTVDVDVAGEAVPLRTSGESRLVLRLVETDGPTVRIARDR